MTSELVETRNSQYGKRRIPWLRSDIDEFFGVLRREERESDQYPLGKP